MPNSRRTRDYRAEEARRNAKARQLGFTSRAQMRRALAQGWEPQRKGRVIVAPPAGEPMRPVARGITGQRRKKLEAAQWSRIHSRKRTSRFNPDWPSDKVDAYYDAFVNPDTRANKIENELYALRDFLVDTMGYYTDETFDDRYGVSYVQEMVARYESPELSARLGTTTE